MSTDIFYLVEKRLHLAKHLDKALLFSAVKMHLFFTGNDIIYMKPTFFSYQGWYMVHIPCVE